MAFFINPALLAPKKKAGSNNLRNSRNGPPIAVPDKKPDDTVDQLFADIGNFDIRKGICSNIMNPAPELNENGSTPAQRSLMGQYDRGGLLFDVYQNLDPFEVKLRINAFEKENFKLVSAAQMAGDDLKKYLKSDKKSFLMEGQNRHDLGKYLVENILVDEANHDMMLLRAP